MDEPVTPVTETQSRKLPWFRIHTEARNDAKLEILTDAQHRVWFRLMCLAAEQTEQRGTIRDMDEELLAVYVARGDLDLLRETINRLVMLRIVSVEPASVEFINWTKRQYTNPSAAPENANARKAKSRDKSGDVTTHDKGSHETSPTLSRDKSDVVTTLSRPSHDAVTAPEYRVQSTDNRTQIVDPTTQTTENDSVAIATGANAVEFDDFADVDMFVEMIESTTAERVTEPAKEKRPAVPQSAPFALLMAFQELIGGDDPTRWDDGKRKRFCGYAKNLLRSYSAEDVLDCTRWLMANPWQVADGISLTKVQVKIQGWLDTARDAPAPVSAPSRTSSRRVMTPEELAMEAEYTYDD